MQESRIAAGALADEEGKNKISELIARSKPISDRCFQTHAEHQLAKLAKRGLTKTIARSKSAKTILKDLTEKQKSLLHPALREFAEKMVA